MHDRPTYRPVYKALHRPLTVCGVDRRLFFLALLMGAATFNLFYSFLAGVLVVRRPLRLRPVGDEARPADAAHPAVVLAVQSALRRGEARPRSTSRCAHGEPARASCATTGTPAASTACWRSGASSTTTRFSPRPAMSGSCIASAASTTNASTTPSAATSSTDSRRRFGCSMSRCRVYQYLCKRRIGRCRGRAVQPAPGRTKPSRRRAEYLNARGAELYELDLYLVLVYEGLRPRHVTSHAAPRDSCAHPRRALRDWLSSERRARRCSRTISIARWRSCITRRRRSRCSSPTASGRPARTRRTRSASSGGW